MFWYILLRVYGQYKYFYISQVDPRAVRFKTLLITVYVYKVMNHEGRQERPQGVKGVKLKGNKAYIGLKGI